jgi:hypothetical protein
MLVPFAEYRPDEANLNAAFTDDVMNVLCSATSYIPFPDFAAFTSALLSQPFGYFQARSSSGQVTTFAGTATKLYVLDNTTLTWTDVTKIAATYGANTDARWCFEQFGDYVVAVNINDNPQEFHLGVSTNFIDLAGSPPRAAFVRARGDFLALEHLSTNVNRTHWSALNDIHGWTPGTNNSDYQDFPEGGGIQGSSRATNPLIILERAIYLGTFVPGSSIIFSFVKIHDKRGAKSPYSIASRGDVTFFADEGSFFQIGADGSITDIGFEKVSRTIFGRVASTNLATMVGAIDPFYSRFYCTMDLTGGGTYTNILIYDWQLQKWSIAEQTNVGIFPSATAGYTLEGLNAVATLDALPYSLDSKVWQGGAPILAAFDSTYRMGFFNGQAKEARITTQEMGDTSGMVTRVNAVLPVIDTAAALVSIGKRFRRGDTFVWSAEAAQSTNTGIARKNSRCRYHRFKVRVPAATVWTHAQDVDIKSAPSGQR